MARIAIDARKIQDFGIGTHVQNLLRGLDALDPSDEFLIFLPPRQPLPVPSARFTPVPVSARNYGLLEHVTLPLLARTHGVDLYHAPHYVLPLLAPRPSVVTVHDLIHLRFPEYLPNRAAYHYARLVMARSFRRAARVLTVSEASRQDLLEWFGGPPDRVVVIPNAVDEAFFAGRTEEELERVRERWRLPGRFILYTGNVKPHKNLERLVRAFAAARAQPGLEDVHLVLMGNHLARYHVLRRLAAQLCAVDHTRFLGWVPIDELVSVYRLATVFAYPSLYEGFGLPPLEAMASGVPVIAANTSSLPEVCADAAILVDPYDVDALSRALVEVLTDGNRAADLVKRGLTRARLYRSTNQAERVLRVYHEVLRESGVR